MTAHVVLTRFSVRFADDASDPTDEWLRHRLELFRRFTVPSLRSQTVRADRWLVLCAAPPEWLRDAIERVREGVPELRLCTVNEAFSAATAVSAVEDHLPRGTEDVLTTRIDSDDAIARTFLEAVRRAARGKRHGFINFTHGLQLHHGRLYRRSDPSNAFISLAEPASGLRTVFVDEHQRLDRHGRVHQISERDLWLQVVHDRNVANAVRGVRVGPGAAEAGYAAELGLEAPSGPALLADRIATSARLALSVVASPHRIRKAWRVLSGR